MFRTMPSAPVLVAPHPGQPAPRPIALDDRLVFVVPMPMACIAMRFAVRLAMRAALG
jgi:hypothetical protein